MKGREVFISARQDKQYRFVQERKAEASLQALQRMTVAKARALRGGAVL